jgi:3-deoxy-D-arabino-heptulosonate 7-phosphate (DAHP) synthase
MDPAHVDLVEAYADILQVGARNVQNFPLLKELGQSRKPVLLKRGMMTTIEELLMSQVVSQDALIRLLITKGLFTKEEFLQMVKVVVGEKETPRKVTSMSRIAFEPAYGG